MYDLARLCLVQVPEAVARSIADNTDGHSSVKYKAQDISWKGFDKGSAEGGGCVKGGAPEDKWAKLGLECVSMMALEEKLEEVSVSLRRFGMVHVLYLVLNITAIACN